MFPVSAWCDRLPRNFSVLLLQDNAHITECVQRVEFLFILFIAFGDFQDVNGIGMTFCSIRKACDVIFITRRKKFLFVWTKSILPQKEDGHNKKTADQAVCENRPTDLLQYYVNHFYPTPFRNLPKFYPGVKIQSFHEFLHETGVV